MMEPNTNEYDILLKTIIIGDAGVGKTAFCKKLIKGEFSDIYSSTIGVDFFIKYLEVNDKIFKLQLWDTAGQEKFESIINSYFRNAQVVIIMLDLHENNNEITFFKWYNKVLKYCSINVKTIVIGNKIDLINNTNTVELIALFKKFNLPYLEISVKENKNINKFETILHDTIYDIPKIKETKIDIMEIEPINNNTKCC